MRRAQGVRPLSVLLAGLIGALFVLVAFRLVGWDAFSPLAQLIAYTPYAAVLAVAVGVFAAVLRRRWSAVVAGLAAVVLVAVVVPRAVAAPAPPPGEGVPFTVMSVNMRAGLAVDSLIRLVRQERPDLLSVQEITPEAAATLEAKGLSDLLPHSAPRVAPGVNGTALYGREPLTDARTLHPDTRFDMARATLVHGGVTVDVVAVHPPPPVPGVAVRDWRRDLSLLPRPDTQDRVLSLLVGDFNATLDHAAMRDLLDAGYRDAAAATGDGLRATWQARWFPPITIDHILVEKGAGVAAFCVHEVEHSDHRAVVADLALP